MKKLFALLAAALLLVTMAAGCGGAPAKQSGSGGTSGGAAATQAAGTVFDAGKVSVEVPSGWKAYPKPDTFDDYEGDNDPYSLSVYKGATNDYDMMDKPGIQITTYGGDTEMAAPSKDLYTETKDISATKLGSYTYEGFSGKSSDTPLIMLWTDKDAQILITIWPENTGGKIALDDADVQSLLGSIAVKK